LLALRLAGDDLDIIGSSASILLIGIVKKNAIMMIDFALEAERVEGKLHASRSTKRACCVRPIMMTTGRSPRRAAAGLGMGADRLRRPLGIASSAAFSSVSCYLVHQPLSVYLAIDRIAVRFFPPSTSAFLANRRRSDDRAQEIPPP